MNIYRVLPIVLLFVCTAFARGADVPLDDAKSISRTAIQWLVFDEWGRPRPDGPYLGIMEKSVTQLREYLKARHDTVLPMMALVANTPLFAGSYDLRDRSFNISDSLPPKSWNPRCVYIGITPNTADRWNVAVKLGQNWSYIKIERGEHGFSVASFERTEIVD